MNKALLIALLTLIPLGPLQGQRVSYRSITGSKSLGAGIALAPSAQGLSLEYDRRIAYRVNYTFGVSLLKGDSPYTRFSSYQAENSLSYELFSLRQNVVLRAGVSLGLGAEDLQSKVEGQRRQFFSLGAGAHLEADLYLFPRFCLFARGGIGQNLISQVYSTYPRLGLGVRLLIL